MKRYSREVSSLTARIFSWLLLINGLWILADSLVPSLPDRFDRYLIAGSDRINHQLAIAAAIGLIYFALKLRQGKRNAWYMALIALAVYLQYAINHPAHHIVGIVFSFGMIIGLLAAERDFNVRSDPVSFKQAAQNAGIVIGVVLLYGSLGFYLLTTRDFHKTFNLQDAIVRTIRQFALIGNSDLIAHTRHARFFLDSLNVLGVSSAFLVAASVFRPVRFALGQLPHEIRQAEKILNDYSRSSEDYFKLWPTRHKHFFFHSSKQAFLSFGLMGGVAVVLDDPVGSAQTIPSLIGDFITYARTNGWTVGFMHCSKEYADVLAKYNVELLPIGQEAVIDVHSFVSDTANDKHFRYVRNKFTKQGLTAEIISKPISDDVMVDLRDISDAWLKQGGRKERTFALGYFDVNYLRDCNICIVRNAEQQVVAFANLLPVYRHQLASVDLMRYRPDAPAGLMNFLFLHILEQLDQQGVTEFNLGFSPLAGIEQQQIDDLPTATLRLIKQLGGAYFSFEGLEQFKGKFRPNWEPRYIAYEGGSAGLIRVLIAALRLMKVD